MGIVHLYIDDSGTRRPDTKPDRHRADGIDHFALGGIMINGADVSGLLGAHEAFCSQWSLREPLHSTKVRGRRGAFSWMGADKARAEAFLRELEKMILGLPVVGIACVIDRPGYMARYAHAYDQPWLLCKTAYTILIERAAKFATLNGDNLIVYFEGAGKNEDRDILTYARLLREKGMPFDVARSALYEGLRSVDFRSIVIGSPHRVTKAVPMMQIADMVLYPMIKGRYDPGYAPYQKLMQSGRIIDALLSVEDRAQRGVKYSCFDEKR